MFRARKFVDNIEWMKAAAVNSYDGIKVLKGLLFGKKKVKILKI